MRNALIAVSALIVIIVVAVWLWPAGASGGDDQVPVIDPTPGVGVLGPAWSTTAPTVAPRASRSAPRTSPSPTRRASGTPKPTSSRVPYAPPGLTGSRWVEAIRDCIARRESGRNPLAVSPTGKYRGMYQFDRYSWHAASGLSGTADQYPASVQTQAFYVWFDGGKGRHRWSTYGYCQNLYGGPE